MAAPLSEEQYNELLNKGFTTEQIVQFSSQGEQAPAAAFTNFRNNNIQKPPMVMNPRTGKEEFRNEADRLSYNAQVQEQAKMSLGGLKTRNDLLAEKAKSEKGMALINEIEDNWKRTSPPNVGMLGVNGAGILPQPLHGVMSKIGTLFQLTDDARNDRNYLRFVKQFQSRLAKSAVGEDVGNLAAQEQQVVREGMPALTDYKETGEDMIAITKKALRAMREAKLSGYGDVFEYMKDNGKPMDEKTRNMYFKKAKGNPNRATLFAVADGYNVNE